MDGEAIESKWKANGEELNRLYGMYPALACVLRGQDRAA
jgi:hypothetical protein